MTELHTPPSPALSTPALPSDGPAAATGSVEILLATWNSARWLRPLLDSLLAQTVQDFRLIVSDDCSSDDTVAILETYLDRFRHPVTLIRRETASGTAAANFASLMRISTADHVFLCDADDIWHADKLEKFLDLARRREAEHGAEVPLFLFSDTQVIDGEGRVTHDSYWAFKNTDAFRCLSLERILFYGPMLGCACLMNRALVRLAADVPVGRVAGHDWWIALVAASLGVVDAIPDKTIAYRIHGGNN
jgi:glycosyltransferase involved in cell wall biosynthesis